MMKKISLSYSIIYSKYFKLENNRLKRISYYSKDSKDIKLNKIKVYLFHKKKKVCRN